MDITYLYKGLIIGLSIAAPVGPIGVLCIKRTLSSGRAIGLLSGLGAATADSFYGLIAAFGLTTVSSFFLQGQIWLRLVGGVFLCYLGVKTFLSRPPTSLASTRLNSLLDAYGSTFILTITNPMTILFFTAIFTGFGLSGTHGDYLSAGITVVGVFLGSASWWFILSWVTSLLRNRINLSGLIWVNRISGLIIFGFGIATLLSIFSLQSGI